jgi:hypothetical protein
MSTLADIRAALAAQIEAHVPDVNVYGFAADNQVVPCVVIFRPDSIDFRETFGTTGKRYLLPVQLRVQRVSDSAADDAIDALIDAVTDAIFDDPTLGGVVDSADVVIVDQFGLVTADAGIEYLACNINVEVVV